MFLYFKEKSRQYTVDYIGLRRC